MRQGHSQVFLHHVRRYAQTLGDLLVAQSMLVFQVYRGLALRWQLRQYLAQAHDPYAHVEQLLEAARPAQFALDERMIEVDGRRVTLIEDVAFMHEIAGQEVQAVNLLDLHGKLGSGREFSYWVKDRIAKYGFIGA